MLMGPHTLLLNYRLSMGWGMGRGTTFSNYVPSGEPAGLQRIVPIPRLDLPSQARRYTNKTKEHEPGKEIGREWDLDREGRKMRAWDGSQSCSNTYICNCILS